MKDEKGSVLLIAIIVLFTLSIFGWLLFSISYYELMHINADIDQTRALYMAEAGINKAIYEIRRKENRFTGSLTGSDKYSDGTIGYYTVNVLNDVGSSNIIYYLISIGIVNNITKTINTSLSINIEE